jgi:hypothetical protein
VVNLTLIFMAVVAEETVTVLSSDDEDDASGQPTNKKARIESPDSSPGGLSQFAASPVLSSKAPGRLQLMENSVSFTCFICSSRLTLAGGVCRRGL